MKFIRFLSDGIIDALIIFVSIFLVIFLIFAVRPVFRSQKLLEKLSILFENNAIKTSILLTINNKSKEEILRALSETIEEIDIPLHQYLSKSNNHNEFYNISIDDNNSANFDILIDNSTINSNTNNNNTATTIILRKNIQKYGDILVKKVKKTLDKNTTQNFIESLHKYTIDKNNKIGLAILVGESIEQESYKQINQIKDKNIREYIILIEKSQNNMLSKE